MSKKEGVTRFSVSAEKSLMRQYDQLRKKQGYKNRSLAVADMMRASLVETPAKPEQTTMRPGRHAHL